MVSPSVRGWWASALLFLAVPSSASGLTITEIMYQPPAAGPDIRYVEIYNDTATVLDISGFHFSSGIRFDFPEGTFLPGRSYLVVCADVAAVEAHYGITNLVGNFLGNLDPDGETLEISSSSSVKQVEVSYKDRGKWPSAPKGTGHSLSLRSPYLDPDDGVNWAPSLEKGGTPGRTNFPGTDPRVEERDLIPPGAAWRYQKGTAEFSSPASAWRAVSFSDGGWLSGPAGIGYGDGDDATLLADMQNVYWSIAARKTFTLSSAQIADIQTLVLGLNYDDGFAAYLNGVEVARAFLGNPGEATPFNAPAGLHEAGLEEQFSISRSLLVAGTNVLAIQVHNNALGSTDLSFIPRLFSRKDLPAPGGGSAGVVLNEALTRTGGERWIELHNPGPAAADLSGFLLSDDAALPGKVVLAPGTVIPPGGFLVLDETTSGLGLGAPEVTLFLSRPDGSAVVDAQVLENAGNPARDGLSDARFPDGGARWVYSSAPTPGAPNSFVAENDLVVSEILYNPLQSRPSAGQPVDERRGEFIEIHNRGPRVIPLSGFALTRGVDYLFPAEASIAPGGFLVIAEDPAYLESAYGLGGALGPWEGSLQNDGETIRLEDPAGNTVDEVKYAEGGDWPEAADGQGSSLELIDPRQDNSAAGAWEASDESGKTAWTQLSYTGSYTPQTESAFHFTPVSEGSFLLDDVEILKGATNHAPNGGFESGTDPWVMQGSLVHSRRTTLEAHSGTASLEVIATSGGDLRVNRLLVPTSPAMTSGTYTVRFWARWLRGGNLILAHGFDNSLPRSLWLPTPRDPGTPGRENGATARLRESLGSVNLGPIISGVFQRPVRPGPGQGVTVSASISDADGVASAVVFYRLGGRGDGTFTPLTCLESGGLWTADLPGFAQGVKVLFYLEATDAAGEARRYPLDAPGHTLLYQVGSPINTPLLVYRLSLDDDNRGELEGRQLHSDDPVFGSFVFEDSEIYYNVGLHYHGSPWNRPGSPRMYKLLFPGDRPLHGARKFNISRYGSIQNEATAYYTVGRSGRPGSPSPRGDYRFVRFEFTGSDQGVMSHVETVDRDYVARWFPLDRDGLLLRANGKITFQINESWNLSRWASFQYLGPDKESYRWNWDLHTRALEDEWAPLVALMKVMDPSQTPTGPAYDSAAKAILDVEEMARVLAVRVLNDDWDAIGVGNGQNAYLYFAPGEGRWKYLPWDMDHTYATAGATLSPSVDPGVTRFLSRPEFRRVYLQTFQEMLDGTWNVDRLSPVLDPTEAAGVGNAGGIKGFVSSRTPAVRATLGGPVAFRIRTNGGQDLVVATASTTIEGEAPLGVRTILLNGEPLPNLTWSTVSVWRILLQLAPGRNDFEFLGYDAGGEFVGRAAIGITSTLGVRFLRGDSDLDGTVKLNDVLAVLNHLFREGLLGCREAADANDDGALDVSDAVRLLLFLFAGGPSLPPPFPGAGADPTPDALGCNRGV